MGMWSGNLCWEHLCVHCQARQAARVQVVVQRNHVIADVGLLNVAWRPFKGWCVDEQVADLGENGQCMSRSCCT